MANTKRVPPKTVVKLFFIGTVLLCGCASQKQPDAAPQSKVGRSEEYITGIAAAFYCTCQRWPQSWAELRGFDDALHALAEKSGKPALPRFEWVKYADAKVGRSEEGYLMINLATASQSQAVGFAVPFPDCSRFDRSVYAAACAPASPALAPARPAR